MTDRNATRPANGGAPPQPPPPPEPDAGPTPDQVFAALAAGDSDLGPEQLAVISDLDAAGARGCTEALAQLDAPARFALLDRLVEAERSSALLDFSAIFRRALADDDPAVRALVAGGLALSEAPEVVPHLLSVARDDPDESVRSEAAIALAGFALRAELGQLPASLGQRLIDTLHSLAADPAEDPIVQAGALASVGVVRAPWVQDLIYDAYESSEPALRIGALQAMGRTADEYWLPTLVNDMDSTDDDERVAAARAAGDIGNDDALAPLAELLDGDALDVVEAAAAAIGEIGGPVAAEHLEPYRSHPDPGVRAVMQAAIEQAGFSDDPLGFGDLTG